MTAALGPVLLVGATGSIGVHVMAVAREEGFAVRALVRDEQQARQLPDHVAYVAGDLTRAQTLSDAVAGVGAVVFTHGSNGREPGPEAVDYGAVRNVLAALGGRVARIALMTAIGTTDRKGAHDWKRRGERLVRASGLPYTIVRPSWFDYNAPDQLQLVMLQGDKPLTGTPRDGQISRRQLARVLLRSLVSTPALRKTFELHSARGKEQPNFDPVFEALDADAAGALDAVHDLANMPLEGEPDRIVQDLERVRLQARRGSLVSGAP